MFVETSTPRAVPVLLDALHDEGLTPDQVAFIVVTHAHLDHAGGCSALAEACPRAVVLAHPRAARHLIDPERLVQGARRVYGDETFDRLYGEIRPLPAHRVRTPGDDEAIEFGASPMRVMHTLGHANHHMCLYDPALNAVFTGDAFGLVYPRLQKNGLFAFPSTSPTGFQPVEARETVERLLRLGAGRAYLTHFGEVTDLGGVAAQLLEHLGFAEALLHEAAASRIQDAALDVFCTDRLRRHFQKVLREREIVLDTGDWDFLRLDLSLNGAGVAHAVRRRRRQMASQAGV